MKKKPYLCSVKIKEVITSTAGKPPRLFEMMEQDISHCRRWRKDVCSGIKVVKTAPKVGE